VIDNDAFQRLPTKVKVFIYYQSCGLIVFEGLDKPRNRILSPLAGSPQGFDGRLPNFRVGVLGGLEKCWGSLLGLDAYLPEAGRGHSPGRRVLAPQRLEMPRNCTAFQMAQINPSHIGPAALHKQVC
jgi:hypothetical protein